ILWLPPPPLLFSSPIPPGGCRPFGHDDISRSMEFGAKDALEQSHGFLDEARLLLGRIGASSDRGIDMNRNLRRRAPDGPAGICRLLHQYTGEIGPLAENGGHQLR